VPGSSTAAEIALPHRWVVKRTSIDGGPQSMVTRPSPERAATATLRRLRAFADPVPIVLDENEVVARADHGMIR